MKRAYSINWGAAILMALIVMVGVKSVSAGEAVTAHYLIGDGHKIELELDVTPPAPASIIVIQKLPIGTEIESSTPKVSKYNRKKGVAKFLLRKVDNGKTVITLKLKQAMTKGDIHATIKYKNPATGKMTKIRIEP